MKRKRETFDNEEPPIVLAPLRKHEPEKAPDPYESLPGAHLVPRNSPPPVNIEPKVREEHEYIEYTKLLVKHQGDPVPAIVELYDIPKDEVLDRLVELKSELVRKGGGISVNRTIELQDVGIEYQLAALREEMYSDHKAARLKAIEILRDIQGKVTSRREGAKMEDIVRLALSKAYQESDDENVTDSV